MVYRYFIFSFLFFCCFNLAAQEINQYTVFAGRFDYVSFGNTMNLTENGAGAPCEILTASSATLFLEEEQTIEAAYLYWAGSGTGDFEVTLNGTDLIAQRTFADQIDDDRPFFAAFTEVTALVSSQGAIDYTLSNLDVSEVIAAYCNTGTNFAGWAIVVVYEDDALPLNQVNIFDGLESVSSTQNDLTITLENLNVLDNNNAKIGFVAWEGDAGLAVDETLSINGTILSNPPLNPPNNQFNGTNSFTEQADLYNMDIDFYGIENNIEIGDTEAIIELTSGQDFVMINTVITVLNSQLPDGVSTIDEILTSCDSQDIEVFYTITNLGTEVFPAGAPIAFYGDDVLLEVITLPSTLQPNESFSQSSVLSIPETIDTPFNLEISLDNNGSGEGIVVESNENNNDDSALVVLENLSVNLIEDVNFCDLDSNGSEPIDLQALSLMAIENQDQITVSIYSSEEDALNEENAIDDTTYLLSQEEEELFFRFYDESSTCFTIVPVTFFLVSPPSITTLLDLTVCDDVTNDGQAMFDLTVQEEGILNSNNQVIIGYYSSLEEAESSVNAIQSPETYINSTNPEQIFVRVMNENAPSCLAISTFFLEVNPVNNILQLPDLTVCNEGFELGMYDLTLVEAGISLEEDMVITGYYTNSVDAFALQNEISDPYNYSSIQPEQSIFIRTDDSLNLDCYHLSEFKLLTENCTPFVPEGFSPNGDAFNNTFKISGLKDIFVNYKLLIYSRLGNLVYEGDNDEPFWDGTPNRGVGGTSNPTGVYYWILYLNDPAVKDMTGWVYLNR